MKHFRKISLGKAITAEPLDPISRLLVPILIVVENEKTSKAEPQQQE